MEIRGDNTCVMEWINGEAQQAKRMRVISEAQRKVKHVLEEGWDSGCRSVNWARDVAVSPVLALLEDTLGSGPRKATNMTNILGEVVFRVIAIPQSEGLSRY